MTPFYHLMHFALAMTTYKDAYVYQGQNDPYGRRKINNSERNFQKVIQSDILTLTKVNKYFGAIGLRDYLTIAISTEETLKVNFNTANQGVIVNAIGRDIATLARLESLISIQNDIRKDNPKLAPCINYFNAQLYNITIDRQRAFYPDILFHQPRTDLFQKLCCEVKILDPRLECYKNDIVRLHGFVCKIDNNRKRGLKYEIGYFIFRGKENQNNLDMLHQIAANHHFPESYRIFVWYFLYDGNGTKSDPGRWVCMPFTEVCRLFAHDGGNISTLNYTEEDLNTWIVNHPDQPQVQ